MTDWRRNVKWWALVLLLVITVLIWYLVWRADQGVLTVAFLDIGQGDSIYIEGPNGNQILVDGGPNSAVLRRLSSVMPLFDHSIDVVVETHPDADHIAGLVDVFERYKVSYFLEPGIPNDTAPYMALQEKVQNEKGLSKVIARRNMRIDLGRGAQLHILFPDRDVSGVETNTGSIVARLEYGKTSVLLTGDSPIAIESYLVSLNKEDLKSTILKLGHHGSRTSSSQEFVEAVNPDMAIISAGKDNRYGHPHKEVISMLESLHIPFLSTAREGTILYRSNGISFSKK